MVKQDTIPFILILL